MQTPQRGRQSARPGAKDELVAFPNYVPAFDQSTSSLSSVSSTPSKKQMMTPQNVYDAMEREQEAIVNKLQREIHTLRDRSRSRSRSSSHSSSMRPPDVTRPRASAGEHDVIQTLRRELDIHKRKIAELTMKLTEKDLEIETLKRSLNDKSGVAK